MFSSRKLVVLRPTPKKSLTVTVDAHICQDYVQSEISRLEGLLSKGSISPEKKSLFMLRKDILTEFREAQEGGAASDEL